MGFLLSLLAFPRCFHFLTFTVINCCNVRHEKNCLVLSKQAPYWSLSKKLSIGSYRPTNGMEDRGTGTKVMAEAGY